MSACMHINFQKYISSDGDANYFKMAKKRKFNVIHKRKSDLLYICCQSPKFRKELLRHADPELVKCVGQCATNVLDGSLPITKSEKTKLKKYKKTLRRIKQGKNKKRIIVQSGGGFLLSLIPAVVGALASLIK